MLLIGTTPDGEKVYRLESADGRSFSGRLEPPNQGPVAGSETVWVILPGGIGRSGTFHAHTKPAGSVTLSNCIASEDKILQGNARTVPVASGENFETGLYTPLSAVKIEMTAPLHYVELLVTASREV